MLRISAGSFLLIALASVALAQEAAVTPAKPWQVTCVSQQTSSDLVCNMSQTLLAGETGQRVLAATIARKDGNLVLRLSLPHGLKLADGVRLSVDGGAETQFDIVTADQNGAYAEFPLESNLLQALQGGRVLAVKVQAFAGGEVVLQLSLAGFTEATGHL